MAIARPVDRRLFFLFDRAHTQMAKTADNYLASRSGVSTAQAAVLIYLGYNDNCRLSDLAEGTQLRAWYHAWKKTTSCSETVKCWTDGQKPCLYASCWTFPFEIH